MSSPADSPSDATSNSTSPSPADDLVAQLAGLDPHGTVAMLRVFRGDISRYTQGSHDALFATDVADLTLRERLFAGWYAALLSKAERTATAYRERLLALPSAHADAAETGALLAGIGGGELAPRDERLAAILRHTEVLVLHPATSSRTGLASLHAVGLTTRAIVTLSQLVAFVTYQVRVVAALRALEATA